MRTRLCQISLECGFAWLWLMCLGYKYNGRCVHGVVRCAAVGWSAMGAARPVGGVVCAAADHLSCAPRWWDVIGVDQTRCCLLCHLLLALL